MKPARGLNSLALALLAAGLLIQSSGALLAQPIGDPRQISFVVAFNPGGSYDTYARLVAHHLSKQIAGAPAIVIHNMQGANGARGASYLADQAARDGTVIGMISQAIPLRQVLRDPAIRFDAGQLNWIGRISSSVEATIVWHSSPTRTVEDARRRETILAATGENGTPDTNPRLMNEFAGTRFKVVTGYPGAAATMLAMERGEVEGAYTGLENLLSTKSDWLRDRKITVLVQYSQARHKSFPDVPAMVEFARSPEDGRILSLYASAADIGIALVAPPRLSAEILARLRRAFDAMMADRDFLGDAASRQMDVQPMPGEALQQLVAEVLATPPDLAKRAAVSRDAN
jgi:tripartite-type tricarboxylate transporter receptor subunit TctC